MCIGNPEKARIAFATTVGSQGWRASGRMISFPDRGQELIALKYVPLP